MRILQLTHAYAPQIGGVERHVQAISEQLAELGHEVVVATMSSSDIVLESEPLTNVKVRRFRSIGLGVAYRVPVGLPLYLQVTRDHFDVVHVHNYHAVLLPLAAAIRPRCLIVTPHFNDRPHSRFAEILHRPYALIGRRALLRADRVICVSTIERDRLVRRLRVPSGRIVVIPNGVDIKRFQFRSTSRARDTRLLLTVGRLEAYKRVDRVIEALALSSPEYRLAIIGDGPEHHKLVEQARRHGLSDRVVFVGNVSDDELINWYHRAYMLVNLSSAEAFGLTVLEAVVAGCQVVCSDIPAFKELSDRFPSQITVVPDGDPRAVANVVATTEQDDDNSPFDLREWSWQGVAVKLQTLYESLSRTRHVEQEPRTEYIRV